MVKKPKDFEPIVIGTHRDLRKNIRNISKRFNENPDLARLLIVNPILAFKDVGVQMSPKVKQHIIDRLRFPSLLQERKVKLEAGLKEDLSKLNISCKLPLTAELRAVLFFRVLKLTPLQADTGDKTRLESNRTRSYARQHPIVAKLADYERARQGALIFHTRKTYESYKAGRRQHRWLKSIRFKI